MTVSSIYSKHNDKTALFQTVYRIIDSKLDIVRRRMDQWMARLQPSSARQENIIESLDMYDLVIYEDLSLPKHSKADIFGIYQKYSELMFHLETLKFDLCESNLNDVMRSLNDLDINEIENARSIGTRASQ